MPELLSAKTPLGISACLYDCPVRYNGKRLDAVSALGRERADFAFTPVCPECMAGLGVPREPIHLTGSGEDVLQGAAKVLDRHGHDVSERVIAGAQACVDALERAGVRAVILKEESPSCGLFRARIGAHRQRQVLGAGVFGALLGRTGWFLIPSTAFDSALSWWDWRRRLHAWLWLSDQDTSTNGKLGEAWHVVKFIAQETRRSDADRIGRDLASLPAAASRVRLDELKGRMLDVLRVPTTKERALQALWKAYTFHRKRGTLDGVDLHDLDVRSPEVLRNVTTIASELTALERVSFDNDFLFGSSPVLYRERGRVRNRDEALGRDVPPPKGR
ncbi:MAG: 2-thiouracil desulfurase family protein [Coriobacteriia bacterium]